MLSVLTIAGSDPSGGAGIQMDLKVFHSLGLHGLSVITSVTSQNTEGVVSVYPLPVQVVSSQLSVLLKDIVPVTVKIGMVYSSETAKVVSESLKKLGNNIPLVLDPIFISSSGKALVEKGNLRDILFPLISISSAITPNIYEAETLAGIKITDLHSAKEAARIISDMGPQTVIIKGGHRQGKEVEEVCMISGNLISISSERIEGTFHGTGCCFSSALTGFLALGDNIETAISKAKEFTLSAIRSAFKAGRGMKILGVKSG